jgi:hypothetical protein
MRLKVGDHAVNGVADREFSQPRAWISKPLWAIARIRSSLPKDQRCRQTHIMSNIRKTGRAMVEGSKTLF